MMVMLEKDLVVGVIDRHVMTLCVTVIRGEYLGKVMN
jgi:hypothetical protein